MTRSGVSGGKQVLRSVGLCRWIGIIALWTNELRLNNGVVREKSVDKGRKVVNHLQLLRNLPTAL